MIMSGRALGAILGRLLPNLIKVANAVLKNFALPLGLSAAMNGIDKKIHGYGHSSIPQTTTLIISNDEINDIIKIILTLEDHDILLKGVTKTIRNETKQQKGGYLSMLSL